jgi:hypothetical protein
MNARYWPSSFWSVPEQELTCFAHFEFCRLCTQADLAAVARHLSNSKNSSSQGKVIKPFGAKAQ